MFFTFYIEKKPSKHYFRKLNHKLYLIFINSLLFIIFFFINFIFNLPFLPNPTTLLLQDPNQTPDLRASATLTWTQMSPIFLKIPEFSPLISQADIKNWISKSYLSKPSQREHKCLSLVEKCQNVYLVLVFTLYTKLY